MKLARTGAYEAGKGRSDNLSGVCVTPRRSQWGWRSMQEPKFGRALFAGIAAWVAFALILYAAPLVGLPEIDVPGMLGGLYGWNSAALGWVLLFVTGIAFALLYAYRFVNRLPGAGWQRGLVFGILPWLVMMVIVAPLLPLLSPTMAPTATPGFFFTEMGLGAIMGLLIAHLGWGTVLGAVYGNVADRRVNVALAAAILLPVLVVSVAVVAKAQHSRIVILQDMTDVVTYDPARVVDSAALPVVANVYDRLVTYENGNDTRVVPQLAMSWKISPDGLVYTFELRHGVSFPSGVELSADDVMWSCRRLENLKGPPSHLADVIADVRAVEHYTVRIRLTRPFGGFLPLLTSPQFAVLDGRTVLAHGGIAGTDAATNDTATPWLNTHSAGTGPWILERYTAGREAVLVRNPVYWGGAIAQGPVIFRNVKDSASRLRAVENGRADVALGLTPSEIAAARASSRIRVLEQHPPSTPAFLASGTNGSTRGAAMGAPPAPVAQPELLFVVSDALRGVATSPVSIVDLRSLTKP